MQTLLQIIAFSIFGITFLVTAAFALYYVFWFLWMLIDPRQQQRILTRLNEEDD